jgi:hypothetical protein
MVCIALDKKIVGDNVFVPLSGAEQLPKICASPEHGIQRTASLAHT